MPFVIVNVLIRLGGGVGLFATAWRAWAYAAESAPSGSLETVSDWLQFGILGVVFFMAFRGGLRWEREVTMRDEIIADQKTQLKAKDDIIDRLQSTYTEKLEGLLHDAVEVIPPLLEQKARRARGGTQHGD